MTDAKQPTRQSIIEAALFSSTTPLKLETLQGLFPASEQPTKAETKTLLRDLQSFYAERGVQLVEVASGWRFQVATSCFPYLHPLFEEKPAKYSRALMETLALVAYRQPITRAEIEDVRGVVVSTSMMKTLLEHDWVRVVGHRDIPGRPALYATTKDFLDQFNLSSLEDLPSLPDVVNMSKASEQMELALQAQQRENATQDEKQEDVQVAEQVEEQVEEQKIEEQAQEQEQTTTQERIEAFSDVVMTAAKPHTDESDSNDSDNEVETNVRTTAK